MSPKKRANYIIELSVHTGSILRNLSEKNAFSQSEHRLRKCHDTTADMAETFINEKDPLVHFVSQNQALFAKGSVTYKDNDLKGNVK